ncbi:hypothetical protein IAT40_000949 [Kwoniella sp. CBS 6097]
MSGSNDIQPFITLLSSPAPSLASDRSIDEYLPSPSPTPQKPRPGKSTKTRRGSRGKRSRLSSSSSSSPSPKVKIETKVEAQSKSEKKRRGRPAGSTSAGTGVGSGTKGGKKMGSWTKEEVRQLWDALGLLPVKVKWDDVAAKVEGRDKTWRYDMMPKLQAFIDTLGE